MRLRSLPIILLVPLLANCAAVHRPVVPSPPLPDTRAAWERIVLPGDRARLDALAQTWQTALAAVPTRARAALASEGPLLAATAAQEQPSLPPGPYYCRLLRFGGRAGLTSFKPDFCIVESTKSGISFTKQGGANLFGGWLFPDTERRAIFLGTFRARLRDSGPTYGTDVTHDVAGIVERVSAFRWRLSLTRAGRGATLDVYELVPVTPRVPGATPAVPG